MTFDEQLKRSIEAVEGRLRAELAREMEALDAHVAALVGAEREAAGQDAAARARSEAEQAASVRLQTAIADAAQAAETRAREAAEATEREIARLTEESQDQIARLEKYSQEMVDAAAAAARDQMRATDLAARERLIVAVRALDRAGSLTEILDTLASCAGREARRVGLLLAQGDELHGWRFVGFGTDVEPPASVVIRSGESGIIGEAVRTGTAVSSDTSGPQSAPAMAQLPEGRACLAVPITMSGDVVAVLYADQGMADEPGKPEPASTWPDALELVARHAARCLEALTVIKAVNALSERPALQACATPSDAASTLAPITDAIDSAGGEDTPARRYARLLVSEIKMYHEADVAAGRRERDLGKRLGVEIARARVLYEQRVSPEARGAADYFHDELVETLAAGDASLLEVRK